MKKILCELMYMIGVVGVRFFLKYLFGARRATFQYYILRCLAVSCSLFVVIFIKRTMN